MEYPINAIMDRYCFYRQKYVMMYGDMTKHIQNPYTQKQVWEHLHGNISLCVFAGPSNTTFLSIDVDIKNPNVVHKVIDTMVDLGLPRDMIYVSDSGGKGYHVDIFFDKSIYNWMAKELYELIIYFGDLNPRKVEYRPTAKSAIKLPLGVHQKTKRRCWFVDRDTLEPIEDFSYIERTEKIPLWQIEKVIKDGNKRRYNILMRDGKIERVGGKRKSGPRNMTNDIEVSGTRQSMMILEALRLYREGGDYNSIHSDLVSWLTAQDPSLYKDSMAECMRNIDNITGWVMQKGRRGELGDDPNHSFHNNTRIYQSDAERILKGSTKASRLLAFFITVFCDKYGFCGVGENKLRSMLGINSKTTVIKAAKDLVDQGLFYKTKGGYRNMGNSLRPVTNKYRFPLGYERCGEYVEIDGLITVDNVYDLYINTIAGLCENIPDNITHNEERDIAMAREMQREHGTEDTATDAGGDA